MPFSASNDSAAILAAVTVIKPARVIDVGIGYGKYGMLLREALEFQDGRYHRKDWRTLIDGIEIFEPYRNDLWRYAYDSVHMGEASQSIRGLGHYDVALLLDVIEHLPKEAGVDLLESLLDHADFVVVSTPRVFMPQGEAFDNSAERHVSFWAGNDFRRWNATIHRGIVCTVAVLSRTKKAPHFWVPSSHFRWRLRWLRWRLGLLQ